MMNKSFFSIFLCFLSNVSTYLLGKAFLIVHEPLPSAIERDLGSRFSLYCNVTGKPHPHLFWLKDGHTLTPNLSWKIHRRNTRLMSLGLTPLDSGNYTCIADNYEELEELTTHLTIRTPPPKLHNVSIHPSTVIATVHWHFLSDGGYPVLHFTLVYCQENNCDWTLPVHISPTARQYFVYHLHPETRYMFKLWATNKLGPGEATTLTVTTSSPADPNEVVQRFLSGSGEINSTTWMVAVSLVLGTVFVLSCLSCMLIYKEGRGDIPSASQEVIPRIITNPGFEVDMEESYLLEQADYNSNTHQTVHLNNNVVVRPFQV